MNPISRRSAIAAALSTLAASTRAQSDLPSRPITLVVGFAPGGPNDLVARQLALRLSDQLKQQVIVENRPGANGNIAAMHVARAQADGSTLLYNSSSLALSPALYPKKVVEPLAELTSRLRQKSRRITGPRQSILDLLRQHTRDMTEAQKAWILRDNVRELYGLPDV